MAAINFLVPYSSVALTAATAKTVVGINPAANYRVRVLEAKVSFDGATSTNAPAVVDFCFVTFATNAPGTNSTTVTAVVKDKDVVETVQSACAKTWTAEPTVVTVAETTDVGQFNGIYHYICPFAVPYVIKTSLGFGIRINSPNNVNVSGKLEAEE